MKKSSFEIDLNQYKDVIRAALSEAVKHELLGSVTHEEAGNLLNMLRYESYCIEHKIPYANMTEDDFIQAYLEQMEN